MPRYTIKNTETEEIFEISIKYSELEQYFKDNPSHKQVFDRFPATGDPTRLGRTKPPDSFKDILRNIKKEHRGNTVNTF